MKHIYLNMTGREFFNSRELKGILTAYGSRFMVAQFRKRDGSTRRMNFAYRIGKRGTETGNRLLNGGSASYNFAERAHLSVVDVQLYNARLKTSNDQPAINPYRVVNFNTLDYLQVNGIQLIPKDSRLWIG